MKPRVNHLGYFLAILVCTLTTQVAFGDNLYGTIKGTVTDPTGAAVAAVRLTATNVGTGISTTVTSQSDGSYQFTQLPIGAYKVTATVSNFKTFTTNAVTLSVNEVYNLPVPLEVGSVSQMIEVSAGQVQVDTSNTQLQTLVDQKQIVDLPLINRNWTQLEQLSPGVVGASDRFNTYSANGSQSNQSSYLINGIDTNDLVLNQPGIIPSPDAIAEFNLITNTINPEYGRNSGAVVNAVIKNGTNQFHGSGFWFYRDTFLNTKTFAQPTSPVFHQNQFGGTIGGPIRKNHTFFFFSYQGLRATDPEPGAPSTPVTVLTADQRTGAGVIPGIASSANLSPFPLVGDNGTTFPANTPYSTIFSNGTLPVADFNPISAKLLSTYVPVPNFGTNQFTFNPTQTELRDQELVRIDHTFSSKDSLWSTAFFERHPQNQPLPLPGGATLPGFGDINLEHDKAFVADWNHTFGTATLNEFRVGYTRINLNANQPANVVAPSSVGFNINSQLTSGQSLPFIQLPAYFNLGFTTNGPQPRKDQTYEIADNFSKLVGKHTFKVGFDGRRFDVWNPFSGSNNGSFTFGAAGPYSTGNQAADFLLGIPDSYNQGSGGLIIGRAYEYYSYFQDSWQLRPNLTVNYGTGYQIDTPLHSLQFQGRDAACIRPGEQSTVYSTAPLGLVYPGDPGCNNANGLTTKYGHFGPRFGFAWAPGSLSGGASKLSVRGGVGYYYNRTEEEGILQNLGTPPFSIATGGVADLAVPHTSPSFANPFVDVNPTSGVGEANKFPFIVPTGAVDFSPFLPLSINVYSPHYSVPQALNYNLNIQRELGGNTVFTLGYVGAQGRHLVRAYEGNPITLAGQAACKADPTCVANAVQQHALFPNHSVLPGNIFASLGTQHTDGTSNYNSLQASVKKGFSHGFQLQASYTWSHSIDNASGLEDSGFNLRGTNPYPQFAILNKGDSAFDARQRLVFAYTYQAPGLPGHRWANLLIGGWQFSGITTMQTGFPVPMDDPFGFTSLTCDARFYYFCPDTLQQTAPVQFLNPHVGTHLWFNPSSFQPEATGTFGNVRRNPFHGPGFDNTDFVVEKNVYPLGRESSKYMQLRLEAYNVFNHTQFCATASANPCVDGNIDDNVPGGTFGQVLSAKPGRLIQLGAKIYF